MLQPAAMMAAAHRERVIFAFMRLKFVSNRVTKILWHKNSNNIPFGGIDKAKKYTNFVLPRIEILKIKKL